jgi:hypothetical protein
MGYFEELLSGLAVARLGILSSQFIPRGLTVWLCFSLLANTGSWFCCLLTSGVGAIASSKKGAAKNSPFVAAADANKRPLPILGQ